MLLHAGHPFSWRAWHLDAPIVGACLLALGLYIFAAQRSETGSNGTAGAWLRAGSFTLGLFGIYVALNSPIDVAAGHLLSMHMVQHTLLTAIAPPLVLLGLTPGVVRPLFRLPVAGALLRLLTMPVVAGPLFVLNMWLWHVPAFY